MSAPLAEGHCSLYLSEVLGSIVRGLVITSLKSSLMHSWDIVREPRPFDLISIFLESCSLGGYRSRRKNGEFWIEDAGVIIPVGSQVSRSDGWNPEAPATVGGGNEAARPEDPVFCFNGPGKRSQSWNFNGDAEIFSRCENPNPSLDVRKFYLWVSLLVVYSTQCRQWASLTIHNLSYNNIILRTFFRTRAPIP